MEPRTVLVVEDSDKSLKLFCALLELNGYRPVAAGSVADAVAAATNESPSLVLMDIQLPDGDGTDALRQLKANPATAGIPVIAVTAFAMHGDRERFLAAGFDGYVTKPIDANTFISQIAALIQPEG